MEDTTTVLKTDVLGRVKIAKEHREALLDAFEEAGVSGKSFARLHGVNYQTFASWLQSRRKERGLYPVGKAGSTEPLKLMLAEVDLPTSGRPCHPGMSSPPYAEIVFRDGLSVRIHEGVAVPFAVELVKALRSC